MYKVNVDGLILVRPNLEAAVTAARLLNANFIYVEGGVSGVVYCTIMRMIDGTKVITVCNPNGSVDTFQEKP